MLRLPERRFFFKSLIFHDPRTWGVDLFIEPRSDPKIDGEPALHIIYSHNQWYNCSAGKRGLFVVWRVYLDSMITDLSQMSKPYIHFSPTRASRCPLKSM